MSKQLTITDIKKANKAAGFYWFEPVSMRFFRTTVFARSVKTRADGHAFFVTSEAPHDDAPRKYCVREFMPDCTIDSHRFYELASYSDAIELRNELCATINAKV